MSVFKLCELRNESELPEGLSPVHHTSPSLVWSLVIATENSRGSSGWDLPASKQLGFPIKQALRHPENPAC